MYRSHSRPTSSQRTTETKGTSYRVLLVDDQPLFLDIARSMFEDAGGFEIAGEATDGAEAVSAYSSLRPDLVLMDVQMPVMDGFAAARKIARSDPAANIVIASIRKDPEYPGLAAESNAMAFFYKRDLDIEKIREMLGARATRTGASHRAA